MLAQGRRWRGRTRNDPDRRDVGRSGEERAAESLKSLRWRSGASSAGRSSSSCRWGFWRFGCRTQPNTRFVAPRDGLWNTVIASVGRWLGIVSIAFACIAVAALMELGRARESSRYATCRSNLKQIGLGIGMYESDHTSGDHHEMPPRPPNPCAGGVSERCRGGHGRVPVPRHRAVAGHLRGRLAAAPRAGQRLRLCTHPRPSRRTGGRADRVGTSTSAPRALSGTGGATPSTASTC